MRGMAVQALRYIGAAFPLAAAKAEESLLKLKDQRDNNIFKSLAELALPTTSLEDSAKLAKVLSWSGPRSWHAIVEGQVRRCPRCATHVVTLLLVGVMVPKDMQSKTSA